MTFYDLKININGIDNNDLDALEKFGEKLIEIIDNIITCLPNKTVESYIDAQYEIVDAEE